MKNVSVTIGQKYKQKGFDYFVVVKDIITIHNKKKLDNPILIMGYIGKDAPDFETNVHQLIRAVHFERWIQQ